MIIDENNEMQITLSVIIFALSLNCLKSQNNKGDEINKGIPGSRTVVAAYMNQDILKTRQNKTSGRCKSTIQFRPNKLIRRSWYGTLNYHEPLHFGNISIPEVQSPAGR